MDARRARHGHRDAAHGRRVAPLHLRVTSPNASPATRGVLFPRPALRPPPRASLGGDRATSTGHLLPGYPGPCAVVSPNWPAVPRSPAAVVAGSGWLTLRDRKTPWSSGSSSGSSRTAGVPERSPRAPGARRPRRAAASPPAQRC